MGGGGVINKLSGVEHNTIIPSIKSTASNPTGHASLVHKEHLHREKTESIPKPLHFPIPLKAQFRYLRHAIHKEDTHDTCTAYKDWWQVAPSLVTTDQ